MLSCDNIYESLIAAVGRENGNSHHREQHKKRPGAATSAQVLVTLTFRSRSYFYDNGDSAICPS